MSIPKKPTGPITPKGPIKPVARPASKGIAAANPGAAKAVSTSKPAAVKAKPVASAKTDTDKKTTSAPVKPNLETKDKNGDTPLLFSLNLEVKNVDIVRFLVERGSSTKTKNKKGQTPLEMIHAITNPKTEDEEVRTYLEQVRLKNSLTKT